MSKRVYCSVCELDYVGKIPKGGDGSVLFPRKHYRKLKEFSEKGIRYTGEKEVCLGSFREAGLSNDCELCTPVEDRDE